MLVSKFSRFFCMIFNSGGRKKVQIISFRAKDAIVQKKFHPVGMIKEVCVKEEI